MIKRCIVSLAISLLVLPSLQAQRTLSLEECRRLAIDNNKTLAQSRLNQEVAEYTQKAAKTNYLPKLSATAGYMRSGKEFSIRNRKMHSRATELLLSTALDKRPNKYCNRILPSHRSSNNLRQFFKVWAISLMEPANGLLMHSEQIIAIWQREL